MKIRDLIAELIKYDQNAEVTNDGWYEVIAAAPEENARANRVILIFEDDSL